ncbi:MAG: hypothetical protein AAF211_24975 [Myxococcota bacterium]
MPETVATSLLPLSVSWRDLVDRLAAEHGSLAELARTVLDHAPASARLSGDPSTVERGLRRLRDRGHAPGDKYGRVLLRLFGVPASMAAWARALGQYHSRLSDLSVPVRRDQLRLWDRPPIAESPVAVWIHLGLATVAHRADDAEQVRHRLELARKAGLARAEPAARLEALLFEARLAELPSFQGAQALVEAIEDADDRACYVARWLDQRAYRAARSGSVDDRIDRAQRLYEQIPLEGPPFVQFRRAHGLAWCAWRAGNQDAAVAWAQRAVSAAGDGGLLRFRVMALKLLGHVTKQPEPFERALSIARALGDEALVRGVERARADLPS